MLFFCLTLWTGAELEPVITWDLAHCGVFEYFASFDIGEDDLLAIIAPGDKQLALVDKHGELKKRCGGQGRGPGEFETPALVQWFPRERAFGVFDASNRRLSKWSPDGVLIGEIRLPVNLSSSADFLDGERLLYAWKPHGEGGNKPTLLSYRVSEQKYNPLWAFDLEGKAFNRITVGGREGAMIMPWDAELRFAAGSDFIAVAFGQDEAMIDVIDFQGTRLGRFSVAAPRFAITEEQTAAVIEARAKPLRDALKAKGGKILKPEFWPVLAGIRVDGQDRIWAFGSRRDERADHPAFVHDRSGEEIARTRVKSAPRRIRGNALYYIHVKQDSGLILEKATFRF